MDADHLHRTMTRPPRSPWRRIEILALLLGIFCFGLAMIAALRG